MGRRVAALRVLRGDSQALLGQRCGTSQASISRIELDEMLPPLAVLLRMCSHFGCTIAELVPTGLVIDDDSTTRAAREAVA